MSPASISLQKRRARIPVFIRLSLLTWYSSFGSRLSRIAPTSFFTDFHCAYGLYSHVEKYDKCLPPYLPGPDTLDSYRYVHSWNRTNVYLPASCVPDSQQSPVAG